MSQRVVDALPVDVAGLSPHGEELGDADQAVVVDALQQHAELLIEADGKDNFKRAVEVADRIFAVVDKTKAKRQRN
eukprot:512717-Rhodomonas_salina.1